MSHQITLEELYKWCSMPLDQLGKNIKTKVPFEIIEDSEDMGIKMAQTLTKVIKYNNSIGSSTRAIVPCGPKSWYRPFTELVNREGISLHDLHVFHMDEDLDWQGKLLPKGHPYNFRAFMEQHFYGPILKELNVPEEQRYWLTPGSMHYIQNAIEQGPIDITLGGWGQDGHVAYNQARRHPYSSITLDDVRNSSIRIQENNIDTILATGQRSFGSAYQFSPTMSITLGIKECFSAKKIRVFSDTGAWKQTAFRIALFCPPTTEYPMTLLQEHEDAKIIATKETASHPISENPDWEFFGKSGYYEDVYKTQSALF